ncbi:MAG: hypothetical protein NT091_03835 [Candidatus Falkowbacteria bacterium]|nr:hypothetical protein [Candidatus Falkowbacteria bacterium]
MKKANGFISNFLNYYQKNDVDDVVMAGIRASFSKKNSKIEK